MAEIVFSVVSEYVLAESRMILAFCPCLDPVVIVQQIFQYQVFLVTGFLL